MGAKKYAYTKWVEYDEKKLKGKNILKIDDNKALILGITVSGVPKGGAKALKSLDDFNDGFVFKYEDTGKNTIVYNDNQFVFDLTDYLGNTKRVNEKYGICLLPCEYSLGISQEYADLITDNYSKKSEYKE